MCVHVHGGGRREKGGREKGGRKGKGREEGKREGLKREGGKREGGRKEGWKEGREGGTEVIFWDNIHSYEIIMGIVMISSVNEKRYKKYNKQPPSYPGSSH